MVHLFVAEDSELIRKVIRTIVEEHASEVIESADGHTAVNEVGHDENRITFLDIKLPDEQGLNAVYAIIDSIPEAMVDVYRTDLKEHIKQPIEENAYLAGQELQTTELAVKEYDAVSVLHLGLESAIQSVAAMANKTAKYNIIEENIVKKDGLYQLIPQSSLGVFFEISGDKKGGAALILPMRDILNTIGAFKIDFTVEEGTTQKIINELGSTLISGILEFMEKEMQQNLSLGDATPIMGSDFGQRFSEVGGNDDECTVMKLQLVVGGKNIDTQLVFSWAAT